jgi:hypothetical protein
MLEHSDGLIAMAILGNALQPAEILAGRVY